MLLVSVDVDCLQNIHLFESVLIGKPPMNCNVVMGSQLEGWVIPILMVVMLGLVM
jgi:hypothetical protein